MVTSLWGIHNRPIHYRILYIRKSKLKKRATDIVLPEEAKDEYHGAFGYQFKSSQRAECKKRE
jgi:hypothetical protein